MTSMREKIARAIAAGFENDFPPRTQQTWDELSAPAKAAMLSRADAVLDALMEPTEGMIDAGVSFALSVSISGEYNWSAYVRDKHRNMITAAKEGK